MNYECTLRKPSDESDKVNVNAAQIDLNKTNIQTNSINIGLNATKEELKTQKERIDGHATDLSNVSTELDTKTSDADFQDLSTNYAATAADFKTHKGIISGNGASISALNQRVKADEDNLVCMCGTLLYTNPNQRHQ